MTTPADLQEIDPILERRYRMQNQINLSRKKEVEDLHNKKGGHFVDSLFAFITANMSLASLIVALFYWNSPCKAPLQQFLLIEGCLGPITACLPTLMRQWYYLQLRLNGLSITIIGLSLVYVILFLFGQQWAFSVSSKTCNSDLSAATNIIVFVMYIAVAFYALKVLWYITFRVRYSYKQLCISCVRDPYPNATVMSEMELKNLEQQYQDELLEAELAQEEKRYAQRSDIVDLDVAQQEALLSNEQDFNKVLQMMATEEQHSSFNDDVKVLKKHP